MDRFDILSDLKTAHGKYRYYRLDKLHKHGRIEKLPVSIKVLLEAVVRNCTNHVITENDVIKLAGYNAKKVGEVEIPFKPARVILQDFTGVPAVVDLAAMRSAMKRMGGNPQKINPLVPVDLVIDHSVQVDAFGSAAALQTNMEKEFERNRERYEFLHWGQRAFNNFRVVPPMTGIIHQVNLEYLGRVVIAEDVQGGRLAYPDFVETVTRLIPMYWVRVVGGFTEHQFVEKRLPTLDEINAAAPDTPVFILHLYDRALLNRAALRAVGYGKETPEPPGARIERDKAGNPTGLIVAKPNALILYATLALGPKLPTEYQHNSTRHFMRELNRLGITSVIDAGGGFQNYPEDYAIIEQLHRDGELTVRIAYNLFTQKKGSH